MARYEITAVSFHAYAHLTDKYILLPHGASMGDRYGPVVVARKDGPSSLEGRSRRDSWRVDDGISVAATLRSGRRVRRDAVRSDSGQGAQRRRAGGPADSRRSAHVRGRRSEEDCRSWRVVGRSDRRAPAAAWRQRHPARSGRDSHQRALATAARQHRVRPEPSRRSGRSIRCSSGAASTARGRIASSACT